MSDLIDVVARGAYAENDWWRSVAHNDDGKGRYQTMNGVLMRAVEWDELDTDDRDSRLKEARAALAAIEKAGHKIVPVEPTEEMCAAAERIWPADEAYRAMLAAAPKVTP